MGGIDAERDERRGKSRSAFVYDVSREFYADGRGGLRADEARCGGLARRRFHQCNPGLAAGFSEEPSVSLGGAQQPVAGEVQAAAADWSGFRTRHGDAAGRGNFVSHSDGGGSGRKSERRVHDGEDHGARSARGGDSVDLRAGCGREQQRGKSDHQHAIVWGEPGEGFGICHGVYPRRAGERRAGHGEALPRTRRHHGGLAH